MKRSTDGILTTHVGALPMPPELRQLLNAQQDGQPFDRPEFDRRLQEAVAGRVREQVDTGLDVINDGEQSKSTWSGYVRGRLGGFELRPAERRGPRHAGREQAQFPGYYSAPREGSSSAGFRTMSTEMVCTGPISYTGQAAIQADIANLKAALSEVSGRYQEVFMAAVGPDNVGYQPGQNQHYANEDAYIEACAQALRTEYKAITDAGFVLQIDAPVAKYNALSMTVEAFRARFARFVDILNEALAGIPEEQVRIHICFGSGKGPHTGDIMLRDIVDLALKVHAAGLSFEQNVRHEHEWKVWRDVKLPPGKVIIPGVVAHMTDVVEHPELIADRLVRFAGVVGRENVIAGTDCGLGGRLHPEIAWAKLAAMVEGARLASKELWGR